MSSRELGEQLGVGRHERRHLTWSEAFRRYPADRSCSTFNQWVVSSSLTPGAGLTRENAPERLVE
jgi:hypothetical protein